MNEKIILSDADGVLLDWKYGFEQWLYETHGKTLLRETENVYDVIYRVSGLTSIEARELVHDFNRSDYIRKLRPHRDAPEFVDKLYNLGYKIHVITKIDNTPETWEKRNYNLKEIYGDAICKLECMGDMPNKIKHLSAFKNSGMWWIEDSIKNAKDGHELGLKTILVKHEHSVSFVHDDIFPVDTWKEIYDLITNNPERD